MFEDRLVVRYLDGRTLNGFGDSFLPWEEEILIKDLTGQMVHVCLAELKLVCFVKQHDSDGGSTHKPSPTLQYVALPGRRMYLKFKDGEQMIGMANLEAPPRRGFFLTPLNPYSNNRLVFVNLAAVENFRFES
jgi:hypothetical protein